eukprot:GHVQ01028200.1.p1 GENE.GHVQ01028200.1~~GHVQ01028200.1.p1  ORF type:complete len:228 (-),score=21.05 GHVQ01028200.1:899-1582(-)
MSRIHDHVVARAVRALPWESRYDIIDNHITQPKYCSECKGTPRREYQQNVINGIRVAPTFNPYVKLTKPKRYVLDNWPSRNMDDWDPRRCYVRGSRRRYNIPKDIIPYKDELGEWHPPQVSGRYKADIERQYALHGLPWVWGKDFYNGTKHFHDREPTGPLKWYRREMRKERINEAMKNMDETVMKYRQDSHAAKQYSWLEKSVKALAKTAQLDPRVFIRSRRIPRL